MNNILTIDTSTKNASVSIFSKKELIFNDCWISNNNHSIELTDSISKGLENTKLDLAEIDCIAVAIGPGGFSSIRVGISFSLGLCKANNILLLGMPTFEIELESYRESKHKNELVSLIPAGLDAYCWKNLNNISNKSPDGIVNIKDISNTFKKNTFFCGENLAKIFDKNSSFKYADRSHRDPRDILKIILRSKLDKTLNNYSDLRPIYSRSPNITKKKE